MSGFSSPSLTIGRPTTLHRVETIAAIKQPLGAVLIRKDYDRRVQVVALDVLAELAQFALGHGRQQIACGMDRQDATPVLRDLPVAGLQCVVDCIVGLLLVGRPPVAPR